MNFTAFTDRIHRARRLRHRVDEYVGDQTREIEWVVELIRYLVRRATDADPGSLSAELDVVDLIFTCELVLLIGTSRHAADPLLNQPSPSVVDAKTAHQRQRGLLDLGLANDAEGEKSSTQLQHRTVQHRAGGEGRLMAVDHALQHRPVRRRRGYPVALRHATLWAAVAGRSGNLPQGSGALIFAAVALDELAHRLPGQELDFVDPHGLDSLGWSPGPGHLRPRRSTPGVAPRAAAGARLGARNPGTRPPANRCGACQRDARRRRWQWHAGYSRRPRCLTASSVLQSVALRTVAPWWSAARQAGRPRPVALASS